VSTNWLRLTAIVALFIQISRAESAAELEPVNLQLCYAHQFQFAGYYAADYLGYYREEGIVVTMREFEPGVGPFDDVLSGKADYAVSTSAIFENWASGKDLFLIALIHQRNPSVVLVHADSTYRNLQDLLSVPKERLVGPASGYEVELWVALKSLGVEPDHFFSRTQIPEDLGRFVAGELSMYPGYATNEPFRLQRLGVETRTLSLSPRRTAFPGNGLVCHGETWRSHAGQVERFRRASLRGWQYAIQHSAEVIDHILAQRLSKWQKADRQTLADEAAATVDLIDADRFRIGTVDLERLQTVAQLMRTAGLPAAVPDNQVYRELPMSARWFGALTTTLMVVAAGFILLAWFSRRQQKHLVETQLHYRHLVDLAEGYFAFRVRIGKDKELIPELASDSVERILGHALEYYRDDPAAMLAQIPEDDRQHLKALLRTAVTTGTALKLTFPLIHPLHERPRRLMVHAVPNRTNRGLIFDGICIDLTSEAEAEEERRTLHQQLQVAQRHESLALLAGGVAHDFNNLLGAIRGNAELLKPLLTQFSVGQHRLERLMLAVDRASGLVRQILAYTGKGGVEPRALNLEEEIRQLRALMKHGLPDKIRIQLQIDANLPPVLFDQIQFQQVLLNLIVNAADSYEGREGVVTVSLSRSSAEKLRLQVIDHGCGMEQATMTRMFEPYFTTKANGHGLGLAAVQGIIKKFGATLECQSERGQGTTFTIFLQKTAETALIKSMPTPPPDLNPVKPLILVVDDDELLRDTTAEMLQGLGYLTRKARGGRECQKILAAHRHELSAMVLDCRMPDIDGVTVLKQLRAQKDRLPVVLVSGMVTDDNLSEELRDRRTRFLQKPFTQVQLGMVVKNLLGTGTGRSVKDSDSDITAVYLSTLRDTAKKAE
jgi:two-component system, cell cycle sensor histidine kinase and response regulator CckA